MDTRSRPVKPAAERKAKRISEPWPDDEALVIAVWHDPAALDALYVRYIVMTVQQVMEIVTTQIPWSSGGRWESKPISIRAWYGVGTLTDVTSEPITDRAV